jgi:integrase
MMLDTGIRCLEAAQANVGDLRQIGETWYIALAVKGRRQAGAERATIPLSAECAALFTSRRTMSADMPLFVTERGQRFTRSQLTQAMIRLGQKAGITRITASPHRLRHTANVVARMSGVDALTRAAMLNHRSLRTLARYDHLVPGEVAKGREQQRVGLANYLANRERIDVPVRG